jgi:hypothetical protein
MSGIQQLEQKEVCVEEQKFKKAIERGGELLRLVQAILIAEQPKTAFDFILDSNIGGGYSGRGNYNR